MLHNLQEGVLVLIDIESHERNYHFRVYFVLSLFQIVCGFNFL
jgi:hypothetical protein